MFRLTGPIWPTGEIGKIPGGRASRLLVMLPANHRLKSALGSPISSAIQQTLVGIVVPEIDPGPLSRFLLHWFVTKLGGARLRCRF